jgi:hypothetical protein
MATPPNVSEPVDEQISNFLQTIAPDVYSESSFVPWAQIEDELEGLRGPITALQHLVDDGELAVPALSRTLSEEPRVALIARRLFTAPHAVGFADGRELPEEFDPDEHEPEALAQLLLDLGLERLLPRGAHVADLYRVAAIGVDSRRRGFRRKADLEQRVGALMDAAMEAVEARVDVPLARLTGASQPEQARNRGVEVIAAADGRPVAAVATVFQAISGGRQYRDLELTYPRLQADLDAVPMSLIVIADGRGLLEASHARDPIAGSGPHRYRKPHCDSDDPRARSHMGALARRRRAPAPGLH